MLEEAARLARGNVKPLNELTSKSFDAVVVPGGFGAAKNLSTMAVHGVNGQLNEDVERVLTEFYKENKTVGTCCIGPAVLGLNLNNTANTFTLRMEGEGWDRFSNERAWYANEKCGIDDVCVDVTNKVVTSQTHMYDGKPYEIHDSVGKMVDEVLKMAQRK